MTALIAEDEPDIRLVARLSLKRAGFDVVVADNGAAALSKVGETAPDVILLDWMMPELDGPGTCARLKANPATAGIPVIFLTAGKKEQLWEIAQEVEPAAFFEKPYQAGPLLKCISKILHDRARTDLSQHQQRSHL